jgi:hypothetical protein
MELATIRRDESTHEVMVMVMVLIPQIAQKVQKLINAGIIRTR